jgi:hypothetical protein
MQTANPQNVCAACAIRAKPVVSSATITTPTVNYQIVATNSPLQYYAALPSGLSLDEATGVITGTLGIGTYSIPISARNRVGTGEGTLTIEVANIFTLANGISSGGFHPNAFAGTVSYSADGGSFVNATFDSGTGISPNYGYINSLIVKFALADGSYATDGTVDSASYLAINLPSGVGNLLTGSTVEFKGNLGTALGAGGVYCYASTASGGGPNGATQGSGPFDATFNVAGKPAANPMLFSLAFSNAVSGPDVSTIGVEGIFTLNL